MKSTAFVYASERFSQVVVVVNKFTCDGAMFYAAAEAMALEPHKPKAVGKALRQALKASRRVDETETMMQEKWANSAFPPLAASGASTREEFDLHFYPLVVRIENRGILMGAAISPNLPDPPQRLISKNPTDESLGSTFYELWDEVSDLVSR